MNPHGQTHTTFEVLIAAIVAAAILFILVTIISDFLGFAPDPTPSWVSETECLEWRETGELVDCKIKPLEYKWIPEGEHCYDLGAGWEFWTQECWVVDDLVVCEVGCEKQIESFFCDRERECIKRHTIETLRGVE